MGPGEEGTPPPAGQVSAGGADCGLEVGLGHPEPGALLPPGSQGFIVHFPEPVLFFPPVISWHREVRPDTQYTGRKRKPRF